MEVTSNSHRDTHSSYSLIRSIRAGHANPPNPGPSPSHLVIKVPTGKDGDSAQDGGTGAEQGLSRTQGGHPAQRQLIGPGEGPGPRAPAG